MNSRNKTVSGIFSSLVNSLLPKDLFQNLFDTYKRKRLSSTRDFIRNCFYIKPFLLLNCVRLSDGPDIKLFILVGLGRSFFVCCLSHRDSTVRFLLLQCSSGAVRHPRDLQVSVATRCFCRILIFVSS